MGKTFKLIVVTGSLLWIFQITAFAFPETLCLLLSLPLGGVLVLLVAIAAIKGISKWRKGLLVKPMPILIFLALLAGGLWFAPAIGRGISNWNFGRHLDAYTRVVDDFRNGISICEKTCDAESEVIDVKHLPPLVTAVWGSHCDDGGVLVLFLAKTDVLLLHEGYFFKDYGSGSNCQTQAVSPEVGWPQVPYVRQISAHWYRFSDQPGL